MTYRTSATRPRDVLELPPSADTSASALFVAAMVASLGVAMLPGAFGDEPDGHVLGAVFYVVFALFIFFVCRERSTVVRFTYDEELVDIAWLRGSTTVRTEQIARRDIVDVAVDDTPSSGATIYRLVLGTRLGDVDLSIGNDTDQDRCTHGLAQLHEALEVPIRP